MVSKRILLIFALVVSFSFSFNASEVEKCSGATISVENVTENGKAISGIKYELLVDGKTVDEAESNSSGVAEFTCLSSGEYTVSETTVPTTYVDNKTQFNILVEPDVDEIMIINTHEAQLGTVKIVKQAPDGTPVAGVEYTIYDEDGNVVGVIETDQNGVAVFDGLTPGKYTIRETKTVNGMILDTNVYTFVVDSSQVLTQIQSKTEYVSGDLQFSVVDGDGNPISGAKFGLYSQSGNKQMTIKTDANGKGYASDLNYGNYYLVQQQKKRGYALNETRYKFSIVNNNQVVTINNPIVLQKEGILAKSVDAPAIVNIIETGSNIVMAIILLVVILVIAFIIKRKVANKDA